MSSLSDVAARAGVSISTVRRVLYGLGPVRPETSRRVSTALAELAYTPHPYARALVGARAPLIALVIPQLIWHVASALLAALHQRIATLGLRSAIFVYDSATVVQTVVELRQLSPQAVVLAQVPWHDEYQRLTDDNIPVLGVDVATDMPGDTVGLDRTGAFRQATEYLLSLGHRHIGLLHSPTARGRLEGYTEAMEAAGVEFRAVAEVSLQAGLPAPIQPVLERLLSAHPHLTALVGTTDLWAQEAIHHLVAMGQAVPGDISVTGYSNEPWTQWTTPALTTLDQRTGALVELAVEMLSRRLGGEQPGWERKVLCPELIIRESTSMSRDV